VNHYDLLIRDYLAQYKSLSLEKIGTLAIDEKISSAYHLPLQFQYNKKINTTPELIDYIAQRTGKSKVLIQSDIESYTETMRQLINIGKQYEIDGVGAFKLSMSGEYEFSAYETSSGKEEHRTVRRPQSGESLPANKKSSNKKALIFVSFIIIVGILGVIGWGAYNFFVNNVKERDVNDSSVVTTALPATDSASFSTDTISSVHDSTSSIKDTAKKDTMMVLKTDTAEYKFIYETTLLPERANTRTNQLIGLGKHAGFDSIETNAGQLYRLYIKMRLYNADTTREKNYLEKYLQRSIQIVRTN
jgi:nucleoid DNA-binding protein